MLAQSLIPTARTILTVFHPQPHLSGVAEESCPNPEVLLALTEGLLSPAGASKLQGHLRTCHECADLFGRLENFERTCSAPIESDRYVVLNEIGRGGMGIVYRALDRTTDRIVALKVLRTESVVDGNSLRRFENEVLLAREVRHPNLCQAYDFHRNATSAFVTMEYIEGVTLRERLEQGPEISVVEALNIAIQICAGLSELHRHQVAHRDLKPENVIIQPDGNVKLLDFGLARRIDPDATVTVAAGTPAYMAPEQLAGCGIEERTDSYALGVLLIELFSGKSHPVGGYSEVSLPSLPKQLQEVVCGCFQKDVARRLHSYEIAVALSAMLECQA